MCPSAKVDKTKARRTTAKKAALPKVTVEIEGDVVESNDDHKSLVFEKTVKVETAFNDKEGDVKQEDS